MILLCLPWCRDPPQGQWRGSLQQLLLPTMLLSRLVVFLAVPTAVVLNPPAVLLQQHLAAQGLLVWEETPAAREDWEREEACQRGNGRTQGQQQQRRRLQQQLQQSRRQHQ